MRRQPLARPENILALATAEIGRIKALLARITDGRDLIITVGSDADDTTPAIPTGAHTLYGVKHTRAFRVTDGGAIDIDYEQGQVWVGGSFYSVAASSLTLTDDATNYVFIDSSGAVADNATGFPADSIPLAVVTTVAGDITALVDQRSYLLPGAGTSGSLHDADQIIDADGDTSVEVEQAADEDIIRHTIAGTEHFRVGGTSQLDFFNGSILETTRIDVSADPTTVTLALDKAGGGDLTLVFSDGFFTFDTTPAVEVSLTPGSDTSPQTNYVYILQSNKTLTVSTSGWPSEEHAPIAIVILQSAATTQTENALVVHLWHDHVQGSDEQGHYSHLGRWIRQHSATYESGVAQTFTITTNAGVPDNVDFATTAGEVYQMHLHAVPAFDTATGTNVHVINDSVSPYTPITDLADLLTDSAGGSMSGKYFNLVLWASVSEEMDETHLFVNLPSGSYNKQGDATDDVSGFTDFTIPDDFKGTAFLISRITLRHQAASGGTWTSKQETDLRGLIPNLVAGGGTSAITTEFADNAFRLFEESDVTKLLAFQLSGITSGNTRTLTVPDGDGALLLATGLAGGQTLQGGDATGEDLTLRGNSFGVDGQVILGSAARFVLDESSGQLRLPTTGSGAGVLLGGDAQLYRSAANILMLASGDTLTINDANFALAIAASIPTITFDANDYLTYVRGSNYYSFNIGSTEYLRLGVGGLLVDTINELTGATGVTVEGVQLLDSNVLVPEYVRFTDMVTPAVPDEDDYRLFVRVTGTRIQLIGQSATGDECIVCDLPNEVPPPHVNTLTLNWIE